MIGNLSFRYAFPSSKSLRSRSIRIILTIALSLTVVIVVISIMNFLQTSRFDDIRDVRSFDYTINGDYSEEIKQLAPNATVFVYGEGEALSEDGSFLVRYIDSSYSGGLNLFIGDASSLIIPFSLYKSNGMSKIALSMLRKGNRVTTLKSVVYNPSGIYYTSLGSEFDDTYLFLPLSEMDENVSLVTAIKNISKEELSNVVNSGYVLKSWKESEKSLYSAFLVEKTLMYGVLSLLFIIIAVSTKSSVVLFSSVRRKEMAELTILGMERKRVNSVFTFSFLIITLIGIVLALFLGEISLFAIEKYSFSTDKIMSLKLSLPVAGYIFFSLFLLICTLVFTFGENKKREKKELYEVIHERWTIKTWKYN